MKRILECIPNISEGRDKKKINTILNEVGKGNKVKLLHTDIGADVNRTVITFAGEPEKVIEAAYYLVKKAVELIDMQNHTGVHPRIGAVDVCPFVPLHGITMEDTIELARNFSKRVGKELNIPVYCYGNAAFKEIHRNLENIRKGEYEGLDEKLKDPKWKPDFGPVAFIPKTGAIIIGARKLLIAYNINLDTSNVKIARKIAAEIRESGSGGNPGKLKHVKAIGWFLKEHNITQVSTNLTEIDITPLYKVFEEVKKSAKKYNINVTGSEIVGLVPLKALIDVSDFYSVQNGVTLNNNELKVEYTIEKLGLDKLFKFNKNEKILEKLIKIDIT